MLPVITVATVVSKGGTIIYSPLSLIVHLRLYVKAAKKKTQVPIGRFCFSLFRALFILFVLTQRYTSAPAEPVYTLTIFSLWGGGVDWET